MTHRIKLVIALGLATAVILWVYLSPFLATHLIVDRPMLNADVIIVLSGSAVYKERTRKAAQLYKQGVSTRILITNDGERAGWSRGEQRNPFYVELEQRELIANGVMPDAITLLPGEVTGTEWEARALATEIDARPLESILIVTSPYHTRRSLKTFKRVLAGKQVEIGIVHTPLDEHSPMPDYWWLSRKGWSSVGSEYVKSAVYWAYY